MTRWLYGRRHDAAPLPDSPALALRDVAVGRGGIPLFRGLSFRLSPGKRLALVGPNGCGKSTLLATVAGLLPVIEGEMRVFGHAPGACHHRVAYLPQHHRLEWSFPITVGRVVAGGRLVHRGWLGAFDAMDRDRVDRALDLLSLRPMVSRALGELSGGERQRVLIARAVAQEADLVLLDEPLNAVDAASRRNLAAALSAMASLGKAVVVSTHDRGYLDKDFDDVLDLTTMTREKEAVS